jgi:hypothetical protein
MIRFQLPLFLWEDQAMLRHAANHLDEIRKALHAPNDPLPTALYGSANQVHYVEQSYDANNHDSGL